MLLPNTLIKWDYILKNIKIQMQNRLATVKRLSTFTSEFKIAVDIAHFGFNGFNYRMPFRFLAIRRMNGLPIFLICHNLSLENLFILFLFAFLKQVR